MVGKISEITHLASKIEWMFFPPSSFLNLFCSLFMLRTAPVTQLDNRAKRGHPFCFLAFLFPQMRELESSIPDTLQVFFFLQLEVFS